ncbi:MAG TPA: hypothetical protein VFS09_12675, partial [Candidatus Eisenbacteria bacterium]|nr:hypothetical protein [Candidatus Eisenbacteria bacterium]
MSNPQTADPARSSTLPATSTVTRADVDAMMARYGYSPETRRIIATENLLPAGLLGRLHATYPQHSGLLERGTFLFGETDHYEGLEGFRQVVSILNRHGIRLTDMTARELFVEVYRFKASRHALNSINWQQYERDPMFQLMFPQPEMMKQELIDAYAAAASADERTRIASEYVHKTNPHDGHQLLNKPWIEEEDGGIDIVEGSQHKYPQCQLIFDRTTQECFAFCTYCFR